MKFPKDFKLSNRIDRDCLKVHMTPDTYDKILQFNIQDRMQHGRPQVTLLDGTQKNIHASGVLYYLLQKLVLEDKEQSHTILFQSDIEFLTSVATKSYPDGGLTPNMIVAVAKCLNRYKRKLVDLCAQGEPATQLALLDFDTTYSL